MYDLESMREALKKCDVNIKTFEDAIDRELETKEEYKKIIKSLEDKEKNKDD